MPEFQTGGSPRGGPALPAGQPGQQPRPLDPGAEERNRFAREQWDRYRDQIGDLVLSIGLGRVLRLGKAAKELIQEELELKPLGGGEEDRIAREVAELSRQRVLEGGGMDRLNALLRIAWALARRVPNQAVDRADP